MIERKPRESTEINASSMADIAFLLLIFFLVTTTIASDKGITMILPQWIDDLDKPEVKERNVFKVQLNSADRLLVEDKGMEPYEIKEFCKEFLSNNGRNKDLSDSPDAAVVSIKTDRGTTYKVYAEVLDQVKSSYYELRAESVGIPIKEYMEILNTKKSDRTPAAQKLYDEASKNYPLQISEAEPTRN